MIVVFWRHTDPSDGWIRSEMQEFGADDMMGALGYMEKLRAQRRQDGPNSTISHVCMQSELVEVVGEAGVSSAPADYAWYKRRQDPAIKLGRNSGDDIEVDLSGE